MTTTFRLGDAVDGRQTRGRRGGLGRAADVAGHQVGGQPGMGAWRRLGARAGDACLHDLRAPTNNATVKKRGRLLWTSAVTPAPSRCGCPFSAPSLLMDGHRCTLHPPGAPLTRHGSLLLYPLSCRSPVSLFRVLLPRSSTSLPL